MTILATFLLIATVITPSQRAIIERTASEYRLTDDQKSLLYAIRHIENGKPGLEFGVAQNFPKHPARRYSDGIRSFEIQCKWAAGTIKRRYTGDIDAFAKIYCPPNHKAWARMAKILVKRRRAK